MLQKITIAIAGILIIGIAVVVGWFFLGHQLQISQEKFGIYLSENSKLVISDEDIVWYNKTSHEIKLTTEGVEKIQALEVGVYGEPFVIKINDGKMYNGSFWTPISSVSYDGIVIEVPFNINDNTIKLEKGYPTSEFFQGADPRGDQRVSDHFQEIGKLIQ